ncbi:MAG: 30S ribosomal protein S3 [Ktedonobacteraceae bacterium]|nr:30S ribosomal protein S3 [Ktedonobacteraceae bacterium]
MGQKVHPVGFRLGVVKDWQSRWYAERDYKDILAEDFEIRKIINHELASAAVSRIEIERTAADQVSVSIYTARPGIVIGRSGEKVERLKALLEQRTRKRRVRVNINEIHQPELDATLVSRGIAEQLEKRVSFRRAMKQAVQKAMRANAKGIKIVVGGRLGGAEIARSEKEVEGKVPLHTLRADVDYGQAEAHTTFGVIGVKVWIYRKDILPSKRQEGLAVQPEIAARPSVAPREGGERRPTERRRGAERGPRREGERPARPARPQGERPARPARPQGQTGEQRQQGERPARPQGERPARSQGQVGEQRQQGERPARPPRGERPPRPHGERGERGERQTRPEQAAPRTEQAPTEENVHVAQAQPVSPEPSTPPTSPSPPATPATDAEASQGDQRE